MDTHDDPSATTTTTDYDSGDSVIIAYVYEGQKGTTERRTTKERSPRRKRSPKPKPRRLAKCTCEASRADDEDEVTVSEEDTDTEQEQEQKRERERRRRSTKPRPSGAGAASGCDAKDHHKVDKKKPTESKTRRVQTPYIEDYPEDAPRPAIILREHRLLRRSSTSDARRVRDSEDCSPSGSRGRSSSGRKLPTRPPRRSSKESPKHPKSHRRHHIIHETYENKSSGSEVRDFQSDSGESGLNARRPHYEPGSEPASTVARSSAWNDNAQPEYSSSWPRHGESHLSQRQLEYGDRAYDSEEERDELPQSYNSNYDDHLRLRLRGVPSFQEQLPGKELERYRGPLQQATPPPERERERPTPSPHRPRTVISSISMTTMDQGYRSVATSVCEVWRGKAEDWESPYVSASDGDYESDAEEPIQLLRTEDLPPRRSSPRLLPPRGERREFGFRPTPPPPPPYPRHHTAYVGGHSLGPSSGLHPDQTWPTSNRNGLLLLEGPLALTMEPDAMTDHENDVHGMQLQIRETGWSSPGPPRGWTHPLSPRSRAVSPVFSARRTREFLSPTPTRAARFDFDAWECDRASRSSLALALR